MPTESPPKSGDVLLIAASWERWVNRSLDDPTRLADE
jgi:hypothetical protein